MITFAVIGAGRLGTNLGSALIARGHRLEGLSCATLEEAEESRRILGTGRVCRDNREAAGASELVILAVPDRAVTATAEELAGGEADWGGRLVWHASGLLPAAALSPLRKRGAQTAAVHPIQTFAEKAADPQQFQDVAFGIEAEGPAWSRSRRLVEDLGGRPFRLRAGEKPLYHAACNTASGLLAALLETAAVLLRAGGRTAEEARRMLLPLAQKTLQNVKNLNEERALTGPVARGDLGTLQAHITALADFPEELEIYRALARRSLKLAAERTELAPDVIRAMRALLEDK